MGKLRSIAENVQPMFEKNNWTYALGDGCVVPNVKELTRTLKSLKKSCKENKDYVASGRFMASWNPETEEVEYFLDLNQY